MLTSQRALFDIPTDVCFLNAASAAPLRAPHILSVGFRDGMPEGLIENLAAENIYVRLGRMRISPHVYNDTGDIDRFVDAFHRLTPPQ